MKPKAFQSLIVQKPEWYLSDVLGVQYWDKQIEMIKSVFKYRRTIAGGCTASSKSYGAAALVFLWLHAWGPPSRVITLAPTGRQVAMNIWGYLPAMFRSAKVPLGGEMLTQDYKIRDDWYSTGFSTDNPDYAKGIHGRHDLIIIDDAQAIPPGMFKSLNNAMAGGGAHCLLLCNKDVLTGEVYDAYHSKRSLYNPITISAYDTPNVKFGKIIIEGMITKEFVEESVATYGPDDDYVRVFINGEFPKQESNSLVPIDWIEKAIARDATGAGASDKRIVLGVDVAYQGDDKSNLRPMRGRTVLKAKIISKFDPTEVGNEMCMMYDDINASGAYIDIIGIGAGALSEGKRQNRENGKSRQLFGINVSETKNVNDEDRSDKIRFFNLRSKIGWELRESLNPNNPYAISLPNDAKLIEDILAIRYKIHSEKVMRIEPKEITKKRLKRSPDDYDSLCLANHGRLKLIKQANKSIVTVISCDDEGDEV